MVLLLAAYMAGKLDAEKVAVMEVIEAVLMVVYTVEKMVELKGGAMARQKVGMKEILSAAVMGLS
jgi:hypothetical protein